MSTRERQTFSSEFKREAVRLLNQRDKPVAELARELGVPRRSSILLLRLPAFHRISACLHSKADDLKEFFHETKNAFNTIGIVQ